jgi:predicted RNA binding protein YcfA (HicA-like mRNA interferase family)
MPKVPALTAKKVIKLLEKNGYELDHVTGSHHIFRHATTKQRITVPFHGGDIARGTLCGILKDAGISF